MKLLFKKNYILLLLFFIFVWFNFIIQCIISDDLHAYSEETDNMFYSVEDSNEKYIDNEIIVVLTHEASISGHVYSINDFQEIDCLEVIDLTGGIESSNAFDENTFLRILQVTVGHSERNNLSSAITLLMKRIDVAYAQPNFIEEMGAVSNDSFLSEQWSLEDINVFNAWNYSTGSHTINVGVIDSGIDGSHVDLRGNFNTTMSQNFSQDFSNPMNDILGHGTHVAGIIGAHGNNESGIAGINWDISLVSLKVDDNKGNFDVASVIEAITYATVSGVDILNYSGGGYTSHSARIAAIYNFPGLFVCSGGNDQNNNDIVPYYPSNNQCENLISVGSLDEDGDRSDFSNYGIGAIDIYAPGASILSTLPNNAYGTLSGTSMAAPHVTGVAALLLAKEPTLTATELKEIILNSADSISIATPDGMQSVKKLNASEAMRSLLSPVEQLFNGGSGTISDPFLISNEYQFRNIELAHRPVYVPYQGSEDQINYAFKLTDNITLTGDWSAIAYPFTGHFEGNGKYITYSMYLTQEDIDSSAYHGLFREISDNAIIQNLELKNCSITGNKSSPLMPPGNRMTGIGILAGLIQGGGGLFSVKITGPSVDVYVNNSVMGGIAGILYATVSNCEVTAGVVKCYDGAVGGMAGSGDISRVQGGKCTTMMVIKENYKNGDSVGKVYGNTESTANVEVDVQISHGECVAAGTLITLADGSQVPVEQLTGNEMLLVWNMQTGQFDSAPILFIDSDPAMTYRVIRLSFSDGSTVEVIYEHGFWDCDLNQYVYLDENAAQYIGHWFNKQIITDEGTLTTYAVQLTGVSITNKVTTAYSPVTYGHLCYYVNGMLSMPGGIEGLFNIFEVDAETMKYDEAQMQADIAQYGLFTYEEFAALFPVSEEVFEAFNGQYLKVAMGKGLIDAEGLQTLIERYAEFLTEIE